MTLRCFAPSARMWRLSGLPLPEERAQERRGGMGLNRLAWHLASGPPARGLDHARKHCHRRCPDAGELGPRTLVRLRQQGEIRAFRGRLLGDGDLESQRCDGDPPTAGSSELKPTQP